MLMDFYRNRVLPNQQFPRTEIDGDARHPLHVEKDGSCRFPPPGILMIRVGTNTINSQLFGYVLP